jgi:hypothetical protein
VASPVVGKQTKIFRKFFRHSIPIVVIAPGAVNKYERASFQPQNFPIKIYLIDFAGWHMARCFK